MDVKGLTVLPIGRLELNASVELMCAQSSRQALIPSGAPRTAAFQSVRRQWVLPFDTIIVLGTRDSFGKIAHSDCERGGLMS